jgi:GMP synthase-like glutamine amidotransferase
MILVVNNSYGNKKSYYRVLFQAMKNLNVSFHIMTKYDKFENLAKLPIKAIIISSGPIKLLQKPSIDDIIMNYRAIALFKVPLLGICFGLHGGTLDKTHFLFKSLKKNSDLIIPCAFDFGQDRYGTIFHPEFTSVIIQNFVNYATSLP